MSISLTGLLALTAGYLGLMLLIAGVVERGWLPARVVHHPLVYGLSLGVYVNAWGLFGSVALAAEIGYGYLAYFLGVAGAFLLAPVLLVPILRLTRTYQLASLADLFAFRFRSRWVGTLVTVITLLAVLPLLAQQVQVVGAIAYRLSGVAEPAWLALAFCVLAAVMALRLGARHAHLNADHDSLAVAVATGSLLKLGAMLTLGGIALYGVFTGPADLQQWLDGPGQPLQALAARLPPGQWRTLLLLFFAAAFLAPHMFHMAFARGPSRQALLQAGWQLPLLLLLIALPAPLILWAGQALGTASPKTGLAYLAFTLSDTPGVIALVFVAGLAAAAGTLVVTTLALAGMALNHLVLVAHPPARQGNLYGWLLGLRRLLIIAVILGGWVFYRLVGVHHDPTTLGLVAFIGIAQCLPGMLAVLYWPGANRKGMVSGLLVGSLLWLGGLWLPLIADLPPLVVVPPGLELLENEPAWYAVTLISLAANALTFIGVSLMTRTSDGERAAAEACSIDAVIRPKRLPLSARTAADFKQHLSAALGTDVAAREVDHALDDLGMSPQESRPYALRRLRGRVQANLSGLMGPSVARDIVDRFLPFQNGPQPATDDVHYVESLLEAYRSRLTGLARELDGLRRYHRRTLTQLPVGLCAFGDDGELLMWNEALARLSGIEGDSVIGARRESLPAPWAELLGRTFDHHDRFLYKQAVPLAAGTRYLTLHKADLDVADGERGGTVVLIEDHSDMKWLEDELVHAERLASIGRLAAGVAHEIGNPVTGISSLVQNLRYDTDDPLVLETADQIQQLTERISRIVGSLVSFAHGGRHGGQATGMAPCDVRELADEALHLIQLARSGEDIVYCNDCPAGLTVQGDAQRLVQVLVNLLGNARDASPPGATVVVEAGARDGGVYLAVVDTGGGIDPAIRDHLFEPFTTTKPPGEGTGLGLSLVYSIIRDHRGQVHVESPLPDLDHGTRIALWLPEPHQDGRDTDDPDSDR
ncbi:ATP-binding protein [Modicisalibacter tunisiensis]|uniref:histidine kinase n=1 Tax=Modicisalibacter tunisiensis TaxID=390637 RepID=A0ABS7WWJ5_9GAMM|nr:ATP-binding protein [Modicisalibacter tunisiensis]MBZ9540072.1 ATPase [Modicisalibacter tunisiensis]MBZ9566534.1 ATPase [Modicisalibacter tunisiensis]